MPVIPNPVSCGGPTHADGVLDSLVDEQHFALPDINISDASFQFPAEGGNPLYGEVPRIDTAQLTTGQVTGNGVFDTLMTAMAAHLQNQYESERITGREYADVYTASIQGAMGQAVAFLMGKDNAYWQSIMTQAQARTAEIEAVTARVNLENTRLEYITRKANAKMASVDYAIKKMQLAILDQQFCQEILKKEAAGLDVEERQFKVTNLLPVQLQMTREQMEAARAQTHNTRTDGTPVAGLLGKQKDLYTQQITSYQRDAEVKAAKMFIDTWVTQKTINENLLAPDALNNASINTVMERIKTNNDLDS